MPAHIILKFTPITDRFLDKRISNNLCRYSSNYLRKYEANTSANDGSKNK